MGEAAQAGARVAEKGNDMRRYRIKEVSKGYFVIERFYWWCFGWVDVSTPFHPIGYLRWTPMTTLEQAQERLASWRETEAFVPKVYAEPIPKPAPWPKVPKA